MINEPTDPFTSKMLKVRNVLVAGEGFADTEIVLQGGGGMVIFTAPGQLSFKMRREQFDAKSDYEVAFFASARMRKPVVAAPKPAKRAI